MKKSVLYAMFVMLVCGLGWTQDEGPIAGPTTTMVIPSISNLDGEMAARAYLNHEVDSWNGNFGFNRLYDNGTAEGVMGFFNLNAQGEVISLSINGVDIIVPGDPVLAGLPVNKKGRAMDFYCSVTGYEQGMTGSVAAVYGSYFDNELLSTEPIVIQLQPNYERGVVTFDPAEIGVDPSRLVIKIPESRSGGNYDYSVGGFVFYYNPMVANHYIVCDGVTGVVYAEGEVGQESGEALNIVNLMYDGASELLANGSNQDLSWTVQMTNKIRLDGIDQTAKVYFVRLNGDGLQFQTAGFVGRLIVKAWAPYGEEMPVLFDVPVSGGRQGDYYLNPGSGDERLIVELVGEPLPLMYPDGLFVNAWRIYGKG